MALIKGIILLIEQQIRQFTALDKWFQSPLGLSVADEFKKQLEPVLDYLKGAFLVQLGRCGASPWLDELQFEKKWIASPIQTKDKNTLICALNQLPLQRNSLDCVLAPLTIEPFENGLNLVDEVDRILKPMGYVVVLCLNPWSMWGGAVKCGWLRCYEKKTLNMNTPFHLNRTFMQRGYRQCSLSHFYYIPPVNNRSLLKKLAFFNEVGKMLWPFPSGFYCYIAQKYEPITPSWDISSAIEAIPKNYESSLGSTFQI